MRNRNYTKEIDIFSDERPVPKSVTAVLLLAVVVLTLLFARQVNTLDHTGADPAEAHAELKVTSR